jgi:hypothetical protein
MRNWQLAGKDTCCEFRQFAKNGIRMEHDAQIAILYIAEMYVRWAHIIVGDPNPD